MLLCSLLRHQGVPARARCGFGTYFKPGFREDHWVCEVWDEAGQRWRMVDAQIGGVLRGFLKVDFDPQDLPPERFLVAGEAWQRCREGQEDPMRFGIFDMRGLWFIRGNVVRDVAALNRMELLPWDNWGVMETEEAALTSEDLALLDRAAALSREASSRSAELRGLYEAEQRLRVPAVIRSWIDGKAESVTL